MSVGLRIKSVGAVINRGISHESKQTYDPLLQVCGCFVFQYRHILFYSFISKI